MQTHQLLTLARNVEGISRAGGRGINGAALAVVICVNCANLESERRGGRIEADRMDKN